MIVFSVYTGRLEEKKKEKRSLSECGCALSGDTLSSRRLPVHPPPVC